MEIKTITEISLCQRDIAEAIVEYVAKANLGDGPRIHINNIKFFCLDEQISGVNVVARDGDPE